MARKFGINRIGSVTLILVTACSFTDDPRKATFFDGVYNLATGRYQDQIDERKKELDRQNRARNELQRQAEILREEELRVNKELQQANMALEQLKISIDQLRLDLQRGKRQSVSVSARLNEIETEATSIEAELGQAKTADIPIGEQSQRAEKAKRRIERLSGLVKEITGEGI